MLLVLFHQETCKEITANNETCEGNFQMVPNSIKSFGFFPDFFFLGKALMTVLHLDSSNSERCTVKFLKMFLEKYRGKNLMMQIKLF